MCWAVDTFQSLPKDQNHAAFACRETHMDTARTADTFETEKQNRHELMDPRMTGQRSENVFPLESNEKCCRALPPPRSWGEQG